MSKERIESLLTTVFRKVVPYKHLYLKARQQYKLTFLCNTLYKCVNMIYLCVCLFTLFALFSD